MKPSRSRSALFALPLPFLLLSFAGSIHAEEPPPRGEVEVGIAIGRFYGGNLARGTNDLWDRKVGVDDDVLRGFWLGARLPGSWGIEVAVRRTETRVTEAGTGLFPDQRELATLDVASIDLLGSKGWTVGNLAPYVGGGVALVNLDPNLESPDFRDSNRTGVALAAGLRFDVASRLSFRFELRSRAAWLGARDRGEDDGWHDSGRWFVDHEITVGLAAILGRW
jgi:opacity protein-like surface antigen